MRTLTIKIQADTMAALQQAGQQFIQTWDTGTYAGEVMSFESPASLFRLLTPARWGVLEALLKTNHCGLSELARRLERDPSAVHRDVAALLERGLIEKDGNGQLFVPFDSIHTEFNLAKAA
jgi:predicted transcriptional regulator